MSPMARKPIIPVRADEETKARWEAAAAEHSTSVSEFVRAAVEEKIAGGVKPMPFRTKTGRILTDADIKKLADEAEHGYLLSADRIQGRDLRNPKPQTVTMPGGKVFKGPDPKGGKR
jgi:hypothetical protein